MYTYVFLNPQILIPHSFIIDFSCPGTSTHLPVMVCLPQLACYVSPPTTSPQTSPPYFPHWSRNKSLYPGNDLSNAAVDYGGIIAVDRGQCLQRHLWPRWEIQEQMEIRLTALIGYTELCQNLTQFIWNNVHNITMA